MDKRVKHIIEHAQSNFVDYRLLIAQLESFSNNFLSLESTSNPIAKRLPNLKNREVKWVIQEYSQFSNEAIHMLLDARIRTWEWHDLAQEIDRNMEEEKGSKTEGRPHLEMMRMGYSHGLDFDVNNYRPSYVTKVFLEIMRNIFRNKINPYVAGALLALESTSIPEFYVLDALVKRYHADHLQTPNKSLTEYIDGHKIFEQGHKEGLTNAIAPYIKAHHAEDFAKGYLDVCVAMSDWWASLSQAITDRKLSKFLLGVFL